MPTSMTDMSEYFNSRAASMLAGFPQTQAGAGGNRGLVMQQFEVIHEMLSGLETLTAAGQRHSIGKILAFIQARLGESGLMSSRRNRDTVGQLLGQLGHEVDSPWPNIREVRQRTECLIALLSNTAAPASSASTIAGITK